MCGFCTGNENQPESNSGGCGTFDFPNQWFGGGEERGEFDKDLVCIVESQGRVGIVKLDESIVI